MHIWPEDELEWNVLNRNWSGEEMTAKNKTNCVIINFEKYLIPTLSIISLYSAFCCSFFWMAYI